MKDVVELDYKHQTARDIAADGVGSKVPPIIIGPSNVLAVPFASAVEINNDRSEVVAVPFTSTDVDINNHNNRSDEMLLQSLSRQLNEMRQAVEDEQTSRGRRDAFRKKVLLYTISAVLIITMVATISGLCWSGHCSRTTADLTEPPLVSPTVAPSPQAPTRRESGDPTHDNVVPNIPPQLAEIFPPTRVVPTAAPLQRTPPTNIPTPQRGSSISPSRKVLYDEYFFAFHTQGARVQPRDPTEPEYQELFRRLNVLYSTFFDELYADNIEIEYHGFEFALANFTNNAGIPDWRFDMYMECVVSLLAFYKTDGRQVGLSETHDLLATAYNEMGIYSAVRSYSGTPFESVTGAVVARVGTKFAQPPPPP